jgi:hypothetical protein
VTPSGVVSADDIERKCDVLVMATGFQPTNYLARVEVVGIGGLTLRDDWNGEPKAFLGTTVHTFRTSSSSTGPEPTAARSSRCCSRSRGTPCARSRACRAKAAPRSR